MPPNDGAAAAAITTGATPPATAPTTGTPTASSAHWSDSFADADLKGYTQSKGWKDPSELANSYRQFEKLQGVPQDRIIKLPEKSDDPAWQDINYRLGVPKSAKEYQFDVPEGMTKDFAESAKDWFHKSGIPKAAAEKVVKSWNEHVVGMINTEKANFEAQKVEQTSSLKKEWGAAFEQNVNMANAAAKMFGINQQQVEALGKSMGPAAAMKFLHSLQVKVGEDSFVNGHQNSNNFSGIMTPDQAKAQIELRKKDPDFSSRLLKKESNATNEWTNLHKMAHPDQY